MTEIVFDHVMKRYADGTQAVRELSLEIADGEFMILVGPSGCGKSTLLRMAAGLESITDGELRIGGERMNERAAKERDIAMVFQSYALYPHMTVRQNMGFALKLAKLPKDEIARKVEQAARMLDLTEQLERRPGRLSGGQRQRVAMGRALVRDPKAFLMDEPLSNLDAKLRVQMRTEIARLHARLGTTTLFVTHDQTEAMTLGDRVAVLRDGELQQVGTPDDLYQRPANLFVAGFMGSPAMNFVPAHVEGDTLRLPFGSFALSGAQRQALAAADGSGELVAGMRPEDFGSGERSGRGLAVRARIDIVESLGSDLYAYFSTGDAPPPAQQLAELEEEGVRAGTSAVARLAPSSGVRPGTTAELWLDVDRLHLFEAGSGTCLTSTTEHALVAR
jgi:multiple sugar transport system ATP-binding protein